MILTKPMLGLAVGGALGLLDGLSGFFEPSLAAVMGSVITFSLLKGLLAGIATGYVSQRVHSMLLGILAGLWAQRWDHYAALLTYFLIPFSYLSGMFYSTDGLPALGHWLIAANPLYYIIDGLRFGLTGLAETEVWPGALLILVLDLFLGVLLYRLFRRGWRIKS